MKTNGEYILALDVGERRIGLALAHAVAAIPNPLLTLENGDDLWKQLSDIIEREDVGQLVVGIPRDMRGNETEQTKSVRKFIENLKQHVSLPLALQDEAVTSLAAEGELQTGGKGYNKAMIDAQAAAIILQDYLKERGRHG